MRAGQESVEAEPRLLSFRLGRNLFGAELDLVREVVPLGRRTRVFHSGPSLMGVMSLRGEVLPVFGLSEVLGLSVKTSGDRVLVVATGSRGVVAGLCVDELGEIRERAPGTGLPLPVTLAERTRAFLLDVQPGPPPFALLDVRAILDVLASHVSVAPAGD